MSIIATNVAMSCFARCCTPSLSNVVPEHTTIIWNWAIIWLATTPIGVGESGVVYPLPITCSSFETYKIHVLRVCHRLDFVHLLLRINYCKVPAIGLTCLWSIILVQLSVMYCKSRIRYNYRSWYNGRIAAFNNVRSGHNASNQYIFEAVLLV